MNAQTRGIRKVSGFMSKWATIILFWIHLKRIDKCKPNIFMHFIIRIISGHRVKMCRKCLKSPSNLCYWPLKGGSRGLILFCVALWFLLKGVSCWIAFEARHDKTNKVTVRPAKTQISLGIRPVWSESSLSAWRKFGSLATHRAHNEDSDQTATLLVLSCRGSFLFVLVF